MVSAWELPDEQGTGHAHTAVYDDYLPRSYSVQPKQSAASPYMVQASWPAPPGTEPDEIE